MIEDWQKQVDRIEKSYETILGGQDEVNDEGPEMNRLGSGMSALDVVERDADFHGPNRFPPRHKPAILPLLDMEKYVDDDADGLPDDLNELVLAAFENRENVLTHYQYLTALMPSNPDENDFRVIGATAADIKELLADADELMQKVDQMSEASIAAASSPSKAAAADKDTADKQETEGGEGEGEGGEEEEKSASATASATARAASMDSNGADTDHHYYFISKCTQLLRSDISSTVMLAMGLNNIAEEALYAPRGVTCKLNGIVTDWTNASLTQELQALHAPRTFEAQAYAQLMLSQRLPVHPGIYAFLGNMSAASYSLVVTGHAFATGELELLLQFLCTNSTSNSTSGNVAGTGTGGLGMDMGGYGSSSGSVLSRRLCTVITGLYLDNCRMGDADTELLTHYLPDFSSLARLSLKRNAISSAGCTTLSIVLWEQGLPLQALMLDHNRIGTNGALMLSKAMHRCRHLTRLTVSGNPIGDVGFYYIIRATMNSVRKARRTLPRPPELDDEEEGNADFHSDDENSDDGGEVPSQLGRSRGRGGRRRKRRAPSVLRGYHTGKDEDESTTDSDAGESDSADDSEHGDDGGDDLFSVTGENESVYSEVPAKIPSKLAVQLNRGPLGVSAVAIEEHYSGSLASLHESTARQHAQRSKKRVFANKFQQVYSRVRIKVLAFRAFLEVRRRGSTLRTLSVAKCGLGPRAAAIAAHACGDNHYLLSLDLSHNAIGHSELESADCPALLALGANSGLTTLKVRQAGLLEEGLSALVKGANRSASLNELDISGNHCGPTGVAIVASARNFFVDQASFSLGYRPHTDPLTGEETISIKTSDAHPHSSKHHHHHKHGGSDSSSGGKVASLFHGEGALSIKIHRESGK
jgi:predicted nucleic acid-binding protein